MREKEQKYRRLSDRCNNVVQSNNKKGQKRLEKENNETVAKQPPLSPGHWQNKASLISLMTKPFADFNQ